MCIRDRSIISVSILSNILTSKSINGGIIPNILSKPSTNSASVVNPSIILITEFPLSDVPKERTVTEEKIRKYTYTKEEVDVLISNAVREAVEEAKKIDEESMAKHNRDATVISMILGFTTLALFVDGLLRMLGIIPPFMDLDVNILDKIETDIIDKIRQVPIQKILQSGFR